MGRGPLRLLNMNPRVRIPPIQRTNSEGFNRWANGIREALIALRDAYQPKPKSPRFGQNHPFKGHVNSDGDIVISKGYAWGLGANANPSMAVYVEKAEATVTISTTGSIWLPVTCGAHPTSQVIVPDLADGISWERLYPTSCGDYTTTTPTPGTTWDGAGTFVLNYKILDFDVTGGKTTITTQMVRDNLQIIEGYVKET